MAFDHQVKVVMSMSSEKSMFVSSVFCSIFLHCCMMYSMRSLSTLAVYSAFVMNNVFKVCICVGGWSIFTCTAPGTEVLYGISYHFISQIYSVWFLLGTLEVRILALMGFGQFGKSSMENDCRAEGVGLCIVVTGWVVVGWWCSTRTHLFWYCCRVSLVISSRLLYRDRVVVFSCRLPVDRIIKVHTVTILDEKLTVQYQHHLKLKAHGNRNEFFHQTSMLTV